MKRRTIVATALLALLTLSTPRPASPEPVPIGSLSFWCGLFQGVKVVSLLTGNVQGVVLGAVAGGISCGMGW